MRESEGISFENCSSSSGEKYHCICYPLVDLLYPGCFDKEGISDSEHQALVSWELLMNLPQQSHQAKKEIMLAAMIPGKLEDPSHEQTRGHKRMEEMKSDDLATNDSTHKKMKAVSCIHNCSSYLHGTLK